MPVFIHSARYMHARSNEMFSFQCRCLLVRYAGVGWAAYVYANAEDEGATEDPIVMYIGCLATCASRPLMHPSLPVLDSQMQAPHAIKASSSARWAAAKMQVSVDQSSYSHSVMADEPSATRTMADNWLFYALTAGRHR